MIFIFYILQIQCVQNSVFKYLIDREDRFIIGKWPAEHGQELPYKSPILGQPISVLGNLAPYLGTRTCLCTQKLAQYR